MPLKKAKIKHNYSQVTTQKPKQQLTKVTNTRKTKPTTNVSKAKPNKTKAWFGSPYTSFGQEMDRAYSIAPGKGTALAGLPWSTVAPLQRVQNPAARLVLGLWPSDHVSPALLELHWLQVYYRIQFKLGLLVYMAHNGQSPMTP